MGLCPSAQRGVRRERLGSVDKGEVLHGKSRMKDDLPPRTSSRSAPASSPIALTLKPATSPPSRHPVEESEAQQLAITRDAGRQRLMSQLSLARFRSPSGGVKPAEASSPAPPTRGVIDVDAATAAAGSLDAALLSAVSQGASSDEVAGLLARGASADAAMIGGGTALAIAARRCASSAVEALLMYGASVDLKDELGWTALMHAIDAHSPGFSREQVISHLLDSGAAVDVWGADLRGPFDLLETKLQQPSTGALELAGD